jgi:hypothetical protein
MSLRPGSVCLLALVVGCTVVQVVGCSDDTSKKVRGIGEAGEAGEPAGGTSAGTGGTKPTGGAPGAAGAVSEGGAPALNEAGQGGTAVVGAAGAGTSEAGAPDVLAEGGAAGAAPTGAAGAGPVACAAKGIATGITLNSESPQLACIGATITTSFFAETSDPAFTCCGVSNTDVPYPVTISGATTSITDGDSGTVSMTVPAEAQIGVQNITVSCSSGQAFNTFDVNVVPAPVVTELENSLIFQGEEVDIDGTNLSNVTTVTAKSADGLNSDVQCTINTDSSSDVFLAVSCDISPGDYTIVVEQDNCGVVATQPGLTVRTSG